MHNCDDLLFIEFFVQQFQIYKFHLCIVLSKISHYTNSVDETEILVFHSLYATVSLNLTWDSYFPKTFLTVLKGYTVVL